MSLRPFLSLPKYGLVLSWVSTQTPSSYSRASIGEASIKEGDEEASWGKFTEYDGEVIPDKKGV